MVNYTMKRNCKGCRALTEGFKGNLFCGLGYKVEQITFNVSYSIGAKPLEECPKPKTYNEYLNLKS